MDDGRISKDLLYGLFAQGKRLTSRSQLRYKDVCNRGPIALGIEINEWETLASERSAWRQAVNQGFFEFEETLAEQAETKGQKRKARSKTSIEPHPLTVRKGLPFPNESFQPRNSLFENHQSQRETPQSFETEGFLYI